MAFDISKIEERIDKVVTGGIELSDEGSGIVIKRLVDAMEVAKMMSTSKQAVPSFMRGEPGLCYAAVVRAVRWGMDPYFVAEMSYLVNNRGEEKIAFMSQLLVAVVNARAPLEGRLRARYEGEGDDRVCIVFGVPRGEKEPLEYRTPTLGELKASRGKNQYGNIKGSPLYVDDPDQQMWYYGARAFCRRYFPEVLAGVYSADEFEPAEPKDVTPAPSLKERLKNQRRITSTRGFDADHVARETKSDDHKDHGSDPVVAHDPSGTGRAGSVEAAPSPLGGAASHSSGEANNCDQPEGA